MFNIKNNFKIKIVILTINRHQRIVNMQIIEILTLNPKGYYK